MKTKNLLNKSRLLSFWTRHNPYEISKILKRDENYKIINDQGFILVKDIIETGRIDLEELLEIVRTDNKKRYSFSNDMQYIRANQGHSIKINIDFDIETPPDILFHGTAKRFVKSIKESGLKSMNREFVHMTDNIEVAISVGKRYDKGNKPVILKINTIDMIRDGNEFKISENDVWLIESVPSKYIEF